MKHIDVVAELTKDGEKPIDPTLVGKMVLHAMEYYSHVEVFKTDDGRIRARNADGDSPTHFYVGPKDESPVKSVTNFSSWWWVPHLIIWGICAWLALH